MTRLTDAHDDTVAVSLGVYHMLVGAANVVVEHLCRFRFLDFDILAFNHRFHEMLMAELAELPPEFSIVHHKHVATSTDKIVQI